MQKNEKFIYVMIYTNESLNVHEIAILSDSDYETWLKKPHIEQKDVGMGWKDVDKTITVHLEATTKEGFRKMDNAYHEASMKLIKRVLKNSFGIPIVLDTDVRIQHNYCFNNEDLVSKDIVKVIQIPASLEKDYSYLVTKQQTTIFKDYDSQIYDDVKELFVNQEDLFDE